METRCESSRWPRRPGSEGRSSEGSRVTSGGTRGTNTHKETRCDKSRWPGSEGWSSEGSRVTSGGTRETNTHTERQGETRRDNKERQGDNKERQGETGCN